MITDGRLMTDDDLVRATGRRRYSKQAQWFKEHLAFDPVRDSDGKLVVTWALFEALQARSAGIQTGVVPPKPAQLCFD